MGEETNQIKDWYTECKENQLAKDIKRCNAFAIVSGTVATLSSLVVVGNIVMGNGLEALQVGGSTAAMVAYLISYSKMSSTYKAEKKSLQTKKSDPKDYIKDRLETLRYQLEIYDTSLTMDYIVAGSFLTSTLGHIIEILSMPVTPHIVANITGAALSALVATLYLRLIKTHKQLIQGNKAETAGLERIQKLEEMSAQPIPELIEQEGALQLEAPQEEPATQKLLQLENIPKSKK